MVVAIRIRGLFEICLVRRVCSAVLSLVKILLKTRIGILLLDESKLKVVSCTVSVIDYDLLRDVQFPVGKLLSDKVMLL